MTKTLRIVASGFVLMWLMGCTAGNVEFREAQKAELRKDWDTALVDYEKAGREQPRIPRLSFTQSWFVLKLRHCTINKGRGC